MRKLSDINKDFLETLDPSAQKAFKAKRIQNAFARAIKRVFKSDAATRLVLENVQAVYVMRDTRPYKKGATPEVFLYIYSSDSTVRSELDMRQDWIRLALLEEDIHYDNMKLYASKLNMKKRKPYAEYLARQEEEARVARYALAAEGRDADVVGVDGAAGGGVAGPNSAAGGSNAYGVNGAAGDGVAGPNNAAGGSSVYGVSGAAAGRGVTRHNLSDEEIAELASRVENKEVRDALTRAMIATRA